MTSNRRMFLAASAVGTVSSSVFYNPASGVGAKGDRPTFGLIGAGWQPETKRQGRGIAIGKNAAQIGDIPLICELDSVAGSYANQQICGGQANVVDDYRRVLDDNSIEAVLIATPDHWHAKIAIEAMQAGKDVYCEKPVAVTVQEGKWIKSIAKQTGQVFQVGTQQRSEYNHRFLKAIAIVRSGRLGKLLRIRIGLGPGWEGSAFETQAPPESLDWDRWLGPAPYTEYIKQRTHRTFRWWYEYAGGQLCDWGAHHVDIAQWAIGKQDSGPRSVSGTGKMNQVLRDGMPTDSRSYNTPIEFSVKCIFDDDIEMLIDASRNGITFEGERGRFFVNRGTLEGKPVSDLADQPLDESEISDLYSGEIPNSHMQNFVDCIRSRESPISDIATHHRTLTTCHLANLTLRLGRPLNWNPETESVLDDDRANELLGRNYRKGYEISL